MPEIKTRQGKPMVNTAYQQMQRSFVRSRQTQAAQQKSEQTESPSNYAEEKITRTAEDAVQDATVFAKHEIQTVQRRNDVPENAEYEASPESTMPMEQDTFHTECSHPSPVESPISAEYSGSPAIRHQAVETASRQDTTRRVLQEHPEVRSHFSEDINPIRTRGQQESVVDSTPSPAKQMAVQQAVQRSDLQRTRIWEADISSPEPVSAPTPQAVSSNFASLPDASPARSQEPKIESAALSDRQAAAQRAAVQNIIKREQMQARESSHSSMGATTTPAQQTVPADTASRISTRTIRTRENEIGKSVIDSATTPAQQEAARKSATRNIANQTKARKNDQLHFEQAHYSQQMANAQIDSSGLCQPESAKRGIASLRKKDPSFPANISHEKRNGFHNGKASAPDSSGRKEIAIKKKSSLPIRTRQGSAPIKVSGHSTGKTVDAVTERAFQEGKKAAVTAAQKSSRAAASAGRRAVIAAKKAAELAAILAKSAAEAAKDLYAAIAAGGAAAVLVVVIIVLIGCGAVIFGSQDDNSTETLPLSAEVEAYEPIIREYAKQYGIPDYVLLIQSVMMQESGGRGSDPMQASECSYNTQYPRTPGGITDPEYSIAVGIQNLADCLQIAEVESPIDLDHIQLALQGYNFGSGYITWAQQKYGEYTRANAVEFSMKMAEQMGWNSYGDKQYVPHVLRYYPIGKAFYTPEDGDAIVDVALSQVGNVGGEPYWSWYGFTNHVEWCACFVSWCADQCGYLDSGVYPKFSGCVMGMQWFQQRGLWLDRSTEPAPGMLIFFDWATQDGVPDHVGIVERVENGMVYTVEGNSRDVCRQKQYSLGSSVILGYGEPGP